MQLTPNDHRQLYETLLIAYDAPNLERALTFYCDGRQLAHYQPLGGNYRDTLTHLIQEANREGWASELILAAVCGNPRRQELRALAFRLLGLPPSLMDVARIQAWAPVAPQPAPGAPPAFTAILPHMFDLTDTMDDIIDHLPARGLCGYAIGYPSPLLLDHLAERLRVELGRQGVHRYPGVLTYHPVIMSIPRLLVTIRRTLGHLRHEDVIIALAGFASADNLQTLWTTVADAVDERNVDHRLVLLLAVDDNLALPAGPVRLPAPRFRRAHIQRWTRQIAETRGWPPEAWQAWAARIEAHCALDDELVIEWVYEQIELACESLATTGGFEQLRRQLLTDVV